MAETLAIVGLVSAIVQFVDFSSKIIARLQDFNSSVNEVPKAFRDIKVELPLLLDTIRQTQTQAESGALSRETQEALLPVVEGCRSQVELLDSTLVKTLPKPGDSSWRRGVLAFSSVGQEKKVEQITSKLRNYIQTLTYHQATRTTQLSIQPRQPSPNIKFANYKLGLNLSGAPQIDDDIFVGREAEMAQLEQWLLPAPLKQNIVAVWGLGGIGKTQFTIHFARCYQERYSSIFWLNAKDEVTLKAALVSLAWRVQAEREEVVNQPDEDQAVQFIQRWLSEPKNSEWLIIYDNYDDPRLPGIQSSTGYDIRQFFPHRAHGSILITTRSSRIKFGKQLELRKLEDLYQSLAILANWSGRDTERDADAQKLVKRLDGLPLALTTAGTYISNTADSFSDYLQMYEESWDDLAQNSDELLEYEDRTLYSTWSLSLKQVEAQDPEAVQMLCLMAYLGNLDLWYELFQKGAESGPAWLSSVVKSKARFNTAIGKLQEYSLVEVKVEAQSRYYSLHTCVHDWTLEHLNRKTDAKMYSLAAHCIAKNVKSEDEAESWVVNRRLLQHLNRVKHIQLKRSMNWKSLEIEDLHELARLNHRVGRIAETEDMYQLALEGIEKACGREHTSTLVTVQNLGIIYKHRDKMVEAEAMFNRALEGREKALGLEHMSTLDTVRSLGNLYLNQGKMAEANAMYKRALEGFEKTLGLEHTSTLDVVNDQGVLYEAQGKMVDAERMFKRALEGYEKAWGQEHVLTLDIVNNLGNLYLYQGKIAMAEAMYKRALEGKEKALGLEHTSTLDSVYNLGNLCSTQGKMADAEALYKRALEGYEKTLGSEHTSTLSTLYGLGNLCFAQGKMAEAEAMYKQALEGSEKALSAEHTSIINIVYSLGNVCVHQGKMAEAEAMYERALEGYEKVLGLEHTSTLKTLYGLGNLCFRQGKIEKAEAMFKRVIEGYEKAVSADDFMTCIPALNTFWALGALHSLQGDLEKAKVMYSKALVGFENVFGPEHPNSQTLRNRLCSLNTVTKSGAAEP